MIHNNLIINVNFMNMLVFKIKKIPENLFDARDAKFKYTFLYKSKYICIFTLNLYHCN